MVARKTGELTPAALRRFGLGVRPGDIERVGDDPKGAILAELATRAAPLDQTGLLPTQALYEQKGRWEHYRAAVEAGRAAGLPKVEHPELLRYYEELGARIAAVREPLVGVNERLVWFWANHFAVSNKKNGWVAITVGAYEREAIRPHVFGNFYDLLLATGEHYAMRSYLDSGSSIGPDSPFGKLYGRGLNENYAREVLELHTLGVGGGYTQADVTNLAKVLTGWGGAVEPAADPTAFFFDPRHHEPGPVTVLGRSYPDNGLDQGRAVLKDVVRRPATARFVATKLARHFVSAEPPPALVDRLARSFQDSEGDLPSLYAALFEAPESWTGFGARLRTPQQFVFAAIRATALKISAERAQRYAALMGEPFWSPSGPDGFSDSVRVWASPAGVKARIEVSSEIAKSAGLTASPSDVAREVLGDLASLQTLDAVARAASPEQGLALLLLSSEFQRS